MPEKLESSETLVIPVTEQLLYVIELAAKVMGQSHEEFFTKNGF